MYYSYPCPYCRKVFYTYSTNKTYASQQLYEGIKKHLIYYDEDRKEHEFDEAPEIEEYHLYKTMAELTQPPRGAYEV